MKHKTPNQKPSSKGWFKFFARSKSQRLHAASPAADFSEDDGISPNSISRTLSVLILIHVIAIGALIIHQRFLKTATPAPAPPVEKIVLKQLPSAPVVVKTPTPEAAVAVSSEAGLVVVPTKAIAAKSERSIAQQNIIQNPVASQVSHTAVVETKAKPEKDVVKKSYIVKAGDSPAKIAAKHKVSVDALMKANDIKDPRKIKIGALLKIP